jgi:transposase
MSHERAQILNDLSRSGLATGSAWLLKEWGMQLWSYSTRGWAIRGWTTWITWAEEAALEPMVKLAATIKKHLSGGSSMR